MNQALKLESENCGANNSSRETRASLRQNKQWVWGDIPEEMTSKQLKL